MAPVERDELQGFLWVNFIGNPESHLRYLASGCQLAFPDNNHLPTEAFKLFPSPRIAGNVAIKFLDPEISIALWRGGDLASFMPVPEAAMDKDNCLVSREDDVRLSWEILAVKPEPKAYSSPRAKPRSIEFWNVFNNVLKIGT